MALRHRRAARLRRAPGGRALALLGLYGAAALVATWPAARLDEGFAAAEGLEDGQGQPPAGDHLQLTFRLWLVGHQLSRGEPPWRDPYSFQPLVEPQLSPAGWPFGLPYWPLEALLGPAPAWNLLVLGTTLAAGLLTHAWLRTLPVPPLAAAVGGLAFALAPYRLAQGGWHLLGWVALFLPLALLAFERSRAAATPRRAHAWGVLGAAALVSVPLSGQLHLALGVLPFALAYVLVRRGRTALAWCLAGVAAAVGIGLALRYTVVAGSAEAGARSLAEAEKFSAEWIDFLDRWHRPASEEFVYLGWLTPLLALAGTVVLVRRQPWLALVFALGALVPVLLALGTNLPLYDELWEALPPLRFPRVPERLLPVAVLALAALAAVAAKSLLDTPRARVRGLALSGLVVLDLAVFPLAGAADDPGNQAYAALARTDGRYVDLPFLDPGNHLGAVYDYYALQAQRERPGGYSTLAPERAVAFARSFDATDVEALGALGVRAVFVHHGVFAQTRPGDEERTRRLLAGAGFRPAAGDGAVTLFLAP